VPLALVVLGAAACSSGDEGAAPATSIVSKRPATDPLCVAARKIYGIDQTYSASFAAALQEATSSTEPGAFRAAMKELESDGELDSLLTAYDQLAEAVPAVNREQVATLRDYTSGLFDQVVGMPNVQELQAYIQTMQSSDDTINAGKAALALDNLTYGECGQHLSGG
jgi:hypothetical protein